MRARASRTTHPVSLHLLQSLLLRHITGRDLALDNPYLFKTKTEVTASLAENQAGLADLFYLLLCPSDVSTQDAMALRQMQPVY